MKYLTIIFAVVFALFACKDEPLEKEALKKEVSKKDKEASMKPLDNKAQLDSLVMNNGIKMHWITRGKGEKIKKGDCVDIDYKVYLEKGN